MAYELKIRRTAQAFLLAGYRLTEVHDQLLEMFNVDVPTSTLSDWKNNIVDDEQIQAEAELYRDKHASLCWYNIAQANELLRRNLGSALRDRDKLDAAIDVLSSLSDHGMFTSDQVDKAAAAVELLNECKGLTSTRDALNVVKDLSAQHDRAAAAAGGGSASGTFQITFEDDLEELSG